MKTLTTKILNIISLVLRAAIYILPGGTKIIKKGFQLFNNSVMRFLYEEVMTASYFLPSENNYLNTALCMRGCVADNIKVYVLLFNCSNTMPAIDIDLFPT